jgi:hypothetical protein
MVLGTVDQDGRPWVSPVYYATADYTRFYWISSPEVRHSRNLARHQDVSIVMSAVAEELTGADLDRGLEVYPGPAERGGRAMTAEEVRPPAPYRLYRATASQHSILCPWPSGPCPIHGPAHDHRVAVSL